MHSRASTNHHASALVKEPLATHDPLAQCDALPLPVVTHRLADAATDKESGILHPPSHMSTHLRSDNRNHTHRADPKSLVLSEVREPRPMRWLLHSNSGLSHVNGIGPRRRSSIASRGGDYKPLSRQGLQLKQPRLAASSLCLARTNVRNGPASGLSGQRRRVTHCGSDRRYRRWMSRG